MHGATPIQASDMSEHRVHERRDRRPSPVRDALDDIDYDLDYELALDDIEYDSDPGE
jgi:hypothetical protein